MSVDRREYADGTYLDSRMPWGQMVGGKAKCDDGKVRTFRPSSVDGVADTYFSIPAFVCEGHTRVYGYVTVETRNGNSIATDSDPAVVKFVAYTYRKHHALVAPVMAGEKHDLPVAKGSTVRAFHPRMMGVVWTAEVKSIDRKNGTLLAKFTMSDRPFRITYRDVVGVLS